MDIKVSIITVCKNSEDTIEQTIQSVLNQTYPNVEYIIIDGQSTDKTLDIISKYNTSIAKVISGKDAGIYDAMNKGIENVSGEIIGILNSDDWYEENTIENVVNIFKHENVDIVHGDIRLIYNNSNNRLLMAGKIEDMWNSMTIRHPATFVKNDVYNEYGSFDISYKIAGDYDFLLRCYAQGVKFYHIDKVLTNFRMSGVSNKQHDLCFDEAQKVSFKFLNMAPNKEYHYEVLYKQYNEETIKRILRDDLESIHMGKKLIKMIPDKRVYIWGCGIWGKRIAKVMKQLGIDVVAYLDSDIEKIGEKIENICVRSLEINICYPIIIAISKGDKGLDNTIAKLKKEKVNVIMLSEILEIILSDNNYIMQV